VSLYSKGIERDSARGQERSFPGWGRSAALPAVRPGSGRNR
jgi:hypothetical protein